MAISANYPFLMVPYSIAWTLWRSWKCSIRDSMIRVSRGGMSLR
jgi:hypothetical protein